MSISPSHFDDGGEVHIRIASEENSPVVRQRNSWIRFGISLAFLTAMLSLLVASLIGTVADAAESSEGVDEPALMSTANVFRLAQRRLSGAGSNPFEGKAFYVNPSYRRSLESSIATASGEVKGTLESMRDIPSAYWLDNKGKITGSTTDSMEGILEDALNKPVPELVVFIVYDLPNRDCHAKASNGEICCKYKADGRCDYTDVSDRRCSAGLKEYKEEYIDQIAAVLAKYSGRVPIVLVIEPDSLPNLSTNQGDPRCGNSATKNAYKGGVSYAVKALKAADPYAAIYLDAGHGGWLGWKNNMKDFVRMIRSLDVTDHIRGFASNVAGYQHLGKACGTYDYCLGGQHNYDECCADPCGLISKWNPSHSELNYALHLREAMSKGINGFVPHMIIDTGRNGASGMRSECKNWCNIRNAGVGHVASTATDIPDVVDAYFWLKTPGESDGCTEVLPDGGTCPRFDEDCASQDSIGSQYGEPRAPEAGQWFDYQVKQLAQFANLQFEESSTTTEPGETTTAEDTTTGSADGSTTEVSTTSGDPIPITGNPFEDKVFYVNPSYKESLSTSIATADGEILANLQAMMDVPSAYWLDRKNKITGSTTDSMEGILEDALNKPVPELVVFIVYDLPNRDCHAKASNGEICCKYKADGRCDYTDISDRRCSAGLKEYKEEYIDQIAAVLAKYSGRVPIVLVIEPDSLPNLSTNQGDPRCGNSATKNAYKGGVSYAVKALKAADPYAAIYLDAGHGGWLGWKNNMKDFVRMIRSLDVTDNIRGFASNVAGYQHLGKACGTYDYCLGGQHNYDECCADPCGLIGKWNPSHNELNYALHLREAMSKGINGFVPHMIIDTGRNGVAGMRSECKNWCNIRNAGVGHVAPTATDIPDVVDAYFWLKTPGESDGCTEVLPDGGTCPRFDEDCASQDSIGSQYGEPRAPEAGQWFDYQVKQLAQFAKLT